MEKIKIISLESYDNLTEIIMQEFNEAKSDEERKDILDALQETLEEQEQADIVTEVYREGDVYCKTVYVPSGTILVSGRYKIQQLSICSKGAFLIFSENEEYYKSVKEGSVFVSTEGTRRAAYALVDSVFTSILNVPSTIKKESSIKEYLFEDF